MSAAREAIGEIDCPLCGRSAELHESAARSKVDPESTDGQGKPSYPKKFFIVCPPTSGYRGCGTILANGAEAQTRLMDQAHVFGPEGRPKTKPQPKPERKPEPKPEPVTKPADPPAPATPKKSNPFNFW